MRQLRKTGWKWGLVVLFPTLLWASGCGSFGRELNWSADSPVREDRPLTADEHRTRFLENGDPKSFRWLLGHRVSQGMKVSEVNYILGVDGTREPLAARYKRDGGPYQESDVGYRWGPDREGHSVCLFFREGKLYNYDPEQFQKKDVEWD